MLGSHSFLCGRQGKTASSHFCSNYLSVSLTLSFALNPGVPSKGLSLWQNVTAKSWGGIRRASIMFLQMNHVPQLPKIRRSTHDGTDGSASDYSPPESIFPNFPSLLVGETSDFIKRWGI